MEELDVKTADESAAGNLCSICQTVIVGGEFYVNCPDCQLPFHDECWKENRGCAQYGCSSASHMENKDGGPELLSTAWAGEKKCPRCGKTIKGQALKCRFCGADFDTREVLSRKKYAIREYTGDEYIASRNKVIGLFFLSASGCLSPIAVILLGMLLFKQKLGKLDYERLPATLKLLVQCAFGINCLLLLLFIIFAIFD
ncbi:RING finger protein [candidate division CSSED10-310 bacterium]|uniref:RING finger protein n=1 Tax=candidate division CSSED10-310 bacterium TaxID=2855610 RepID=A0ABV6YSY6_UNCC1